MAPKNPGADIYVATESGAVELDGTPVMVYKGMTRVRAGHRLLRQYPSMFEPIDLLVHYDVEQATAAPGEKRGQ